MAANVSEHQKLEAFKKDLKILLEKHRATLCPMFEGDSNTMDDEWVGVSFKLKEGEQPNLMARWTAVEKIGEGSNLSSDKIDAH